jgi:dTMP kinase
MSGRFITLEGIDGAGKSSHLAFIAERVRSLGHEVITTREPGGTELGEKLRALLLHEKMHADTEVLLMFASRREQLAQSIEPLLAHGTWVVCDRFTDSTYAYQCGGRGLPADRVAAIEHWVHGALQPDLTLLFDAPVEIARARLDKGTPDPDRFERERGEFFVRVRENYLARADRYSSRIKVINSARSLDAIQAELAGWIDAL